MVRRGFLFCWSCESQYVFDEFTQPQYAIPAVQTIFAGVTTVRQARRLAFGMTEARSDWKLMKKRLAEFMRHRDKWINDEAYRLSSALKGMVYEVPGTGGSDAWQPANAEEVSSAMKDDITASGRQFQCIFLEPIVYPIGSKGEVSKHPHVQSLSEAVAVCNPPFARLVHDLFNLYPEDGAGWLADELLHADLKPERKLPGFVRYEPELIALGVSALKKVVDMYDVTIGL
jgi:hypothetical protein